MGAQQQTSSTAQFLAPKSSFTSYPAYDLYDAGQAAAVAAAKQSLSQYMGLMRGLGGADPTGLDAMYRQTASAYSQQLPTLGVIGADGGGGDLAAIGAASRLLHDGTASYLAGVYPPSLFHTPYLGIPSR